MKKIKLLVLVILGIVLSQNAFSVPFAADTQESPYGMGRESDGEDGYKQWDWSDGFIIPKIHGINILGCIITADKLYLQCNRGIKSEIRIGPFDQDIVKATQYRNFFG